MNQEYEHVARRLAEWEAGMDAFRLPDWESLPQLELYMDQVIILLNQYLGPLYRSGEEKAVTASIINNYVRLRVLPAPRKKKYGRIHIACLVMICILKQSLSISSIQRLLPVEPEEGAVRELYEDFVQQYRQASAGFLTYIRSPQAPQETGGKLVTSTAVMSTRAKDLTEFLLRQEPEKPQK
mgnify:FL=1